jgi:hypothetical protein
MICSEPLRAIPDDVRSYLELLYNRNAARNARIRQQCLEIGTVLKSCGLSAVLLKGAGWLFEDSLAPSCDRMMRDIDLLIVSDQIEEAVRALITSGYSETGDSLTEDGHFHYAPLLPPNGEAIVEIHRDLAYRANLLPAFEVISSATEVATGLFLPTLRHRVAHNVIHAQIGNGDYLGGNVNLRDALDLARLVVRCGPEFDWASLGGEARERGFLRQLSGAIHAANRVLQSPLPTSVQSWHGSVHAWRCAYQRRWPLASKIGEALGLLTCALVWERDAYPLKLQGSRSLRAHFLVNRRRVQRALGLSFGRVRQRINGILA